MAFKGKPVFCKTKDLCGKRERVDTYELCEAASAAIGKQNVVGAQENPPFWKIYTLNAESRTSLLSKGINFRGRRISLYDEAPSRDNFQEYMPTEKIIFKDLPMDVENSELVLYLERKQVHVTSQIKYCNVMQPDGTWSDFYNGDRYVYARSPVFPVLPKSDFLGENKFRIVHKSQQNCCKSCRQLGHKWGDSVCPAVLDQENANIAFRGYRNPLSNMWPCNMPYKGMQFRTLEHAYQWQKATSLNNTDAADMILNARHGGIAKGIADHMLPVDAAKKWSESQEAMKVMTELLEIKYHHNIDFMYNLQSTGETVLAEATSDQYWASGITDPRVAAITSPEYWSGTNHLGKLLMDLREDKKGEFVTIQRHGYIDHTDSDGQSVCWNEFDEDVEDGQWASKDVYDQWVSRSDTDTVCNDDEDEYESVDEASPTLNSHTEFPDLQQAAKVTVKGSPKLQRSHSLSSLKGRKPKIAYDKSQSKISQYMPKDSSKRKPSGSPIEGKAQKHRNLVENQNSIDSQSDIPISQANVT